MATAERRRLSPLCIASAAARLSPTYDDGRNHHFEDGASVVKIKQGHSSHFSAGEKCTESVINKPQRSAEKSASSNSPSLSLSIEGCRRHCRLSSRDVA